VVVGITSGLTLASQKTYRYGCYQNQVSHKLTKLTVNVNPWFFSQRRAEIFVKVRVALNNRNVGRLGRRVSVSPVTLFWAVTTRREDSSSFALFVFSLFVFSFLFLFFVSLFFFLFILLYFSLVFFIFLSFQSRLAVWPSTGYLGQSG